MLKIPLNVEFNTLILKHVVNFPSPLQDKWSSNFYFKQNKPQITVSTNTPSLKFHAYLHITALPFALKLIQKDKNNTMI